MASTRTLNARNLEALGAKRLAALLIEVSTGDAAIKRRLRLALVGEAGPAEAAREIGKRLATIARSRSFIDWHKAKALAADLEAQHRAIVDLVAPGDPAAALDLMWRFTACADPVFARSDDGSGRLDAVFSAAKGDFAAIAVAAGPEPVALAEQLFEAVRADHYGVFDNLVDALAPVLGRAGLDRLRTLALAWQAEAPATPPAEREVVGWGSGGPLYADQIENGRRKRATARLLRQVADAAGDVDAFVAQHAPETRRMPAIAAAIAERLLAAGRAEEAWAAIEATDVRRVAWAPAEWDRARIAVLEALGRRDEAQAFRWERFATSLDIGHLRAHLKALPDFEDFEAEQRAMAHARDFDDVHAALAFLVQWPALDRAAALVRDRAGEIDGNVYEILTPAAELLEVKYPLAATILLRAMIDFSLEKARTKRYGHAARHLATCGVLAGRVEDFGVIADHDAYAAALRNAHGRKSGFWHLVAGK